MLENNDKLNNEEVENVSNETSQNSENVIAGLGKEEVQQALYSIDKDFNPSNFEKDIEEKRLEYFTKSDKLNLISKIVRPIIMVLAIAGAIMAFLGIDIVNYVGYGLIGFAVVALIVYTLVMRKLRPNGKVYSEYVTKQFNNYTYHDARYSNVFADNEERIQLSQVSSDRVYSGVKDLGSRNVCKGLFNKFSFLSCDLSVQGGEKNNRVDLFFGKYITYENRLKFDGRIVINVCLSNDNSVKNYDLPNDVLDLKEVLKDGTLTVYASEGLHYENVITDEFLNKLSQLKVAKETHLINVNVVIWGGHSAIYLSYDDESLTLPYKNVFTKDNIEILKNNQLNALELLEIVNKDKHIKTDKIETKETEVSK